MLGPAIGVGLKLELDTPESPPMGLLKGSAGRIRISGPDNDERSPLRPYQVGRAGCNVGGMPEIPGTSEDDYVRTDLAYLYHSV